MDKNLWQIDLVAQSKKTGSKIFEGGVVFKWKMVVNFLRQTSLIDGVFKGLPLWMACKTPMNCIESPTIAQCTCMLPMHQKPRKAAQKPDFRPCWVFSLSTRMHATQRTRSNEQNPAPSAPSTRKNQAHQGAPGQTQQSAPKPGNQAKKKRTKTQGINPKKAKQSLTVKP